MALVDSLLSAIVRADGDALVMHVGERPYVVVGAQTINISTHALNIDAMTGMLGQMLPGESQTQLEEFGAVEYRIPQQGEDRFSVVAARGGDDIWIEIRRRRSQPEEAAAPPAPAEATASPVTNAEPEAPPVEDQVEAAPVVEAAAIAEPVPEPVTEPIAEPVPEPVAEPTPLAAVIAEPIAETIPDSVTETTSEPDVETIPQTVVETIAAPVVEVIPEPVAAEIIPELVAEPIPEPVAAMMPEAVAEIIPEPVAEPIAIPAAELVAGPVVAMIPEPVAEIAPEPVAEVTPEPVAEIWPEAVAEPVAAAVAATTPEPAAIPDAITELLAQPISTPEPEAPPAVEEHHAPQVAEEPQARELAPPAIEEPIGELPTYGEATAYDPILSEVEAPEPYVIEDPVGVVESFEPALAEASTGDTVFADATPATPIAEEPATFAASIATPTSAEATAGKPPIEQPQPIAASIEPARVEPSRLELPRLDAGPSQEPSVVLPLTRTVRIEVPPRTTAPRAPSSIDRLLRVAAARGATALFLTSDSRPWMRIDGGLRFVDSETTLSRADVESAILEIAPESGQEGIGRGEPTEWIAEFENVGRIRCSTFSDHRGPGVLLRLIATRAATAEQLGLSVEVQSLATEPQGLVLVAGPRASGKSTLISAFVDLVNRQRAEYVIALERQIRLVHENKQALVSQREIRGGADDSVVAARAALRENPDVLVIDDLVSPHMVPLLLTAAAEGLLVFVSITAPSTAVAVERFVELAPPEMRKAVQSAMAESFRGAVAQTLLKKAGGGQIPAREVLLATAPVTRVLGEGQLAQLPATLEGGRKHGMVSFNDALVDFVTAGTVDVREAFRKSPDRNQLIESLKRKGIDTSSVERLA